MQQDRQNVEAEKSSETPTREPLFRRYQIKVKASVRVGAVPTGRPPLGF